MSRINSLPHLSCWRHGQLNRQINSRFESVNPAFTTTSIYLLSFVLTLLSSFNSLSLFLPTHFDYTFRWCFVTLFKIKLWLKNINFSQQPTRIIRHRCNRHILNTRTMFEKNWLTFETVHTTVSCCCCCCCQDQCYTFHSHLFQWHYFNTYNILMLHWCWY